MDPEDIIPKKLSSVERRLLYIVIAKGGISISALPQQYFGGNLLLYRRVPPEVLATLRGKHISNSLLGALRKETRDFARKFHHILLGANLSDAACQALNKLHRRGLISLKPIALISALYDGVYIDHDGWIPTEIYPTKTAMELYAVDARGHLRKRK